MINKNSKGQNGVSLVELVAGEDGGTGGCAGAEKRTGDIFILVVLFGGPDDF